MYNRIADNPDEIYFLFRVDDLNTHRAFTQKVRAEAREQNPDIKLPEKLFLESKFC